MTANQDTLIGLCRTHSMIACPYGTSMILIHDMISGDAPVFVYLINADIKSVMRVLGYIN